MPETPKRLHREPETQQPPRWFVGYRAAASGFPRSSANRGLRKAHRACCKIWVPAVRSLGRHVAKHFASGVETGRRVGKEVVNELKTWLGGFDKRVTAKRARHRRDRRFQTESRFAPAESFREECMLHKVRRGSEHDKFEQPRCVRFKMLGSVYPATLCVATPGRRLDRSCRVHIEPHRKPLFIREPCFALFFA